MKNYKRALIVAPHADDEILGCGGYISQNTDADIHVIVVANRTTDNTNDIQTLEKSYGITYHFLNYTDERLDIVSSSDLIKDITQDSMNCSFFIIVSGVVFFKGHIPERFWNPYGIFNYLNSHVWHHVCCILSIIYGFKSLPKLSYID